MCAQCVYSEKSVAKLRTALSVKKGRITGIADMMKTDVSHT